MSRNTIRIDASPDDVYDVLTDAEAYPEWVVGAKHIRGTDPGWPQPGTRFHHTVGAGPAEVKDNTEVVEAVPNRYWELEVRFRPVGTARVMIDLRPEEHGRATLVTMSEQPTGGPARTIWSRPVDLLTHLRNGVSLWRLRRLVERRHGAPPRD